MRIISLLFVAITKIMIKPVNSIITKYNCKISHSTSIFRGLRCCTMTLMNKRDYGVSFTGAGLLTPYHLGVSEYLTKEVKLITDSTLLAGSSGGALAAITTALRLNIGDALNACEYIAQECNSKGTRLTLRLALDTILDELLPVNSADIINNRAASCSLSYTEVFPRIRSYTIDKFQSKKDLIDCLRASCNIPFYFNGNSMTVDVRNGAGIDGFFSHQLNRFGAPSIATPNELVICPVKPNIVGLNPNPLLLRKTDIRSTLKTKQKLDFQNIFKLNSDVDQSNDSDSDSANDEYDDMIVQEIDIISPALLTSENWPFSTVQNLQMLVLPPTEALGDFIGQHLELLAKQHQQFNDSKDGDALNVVNSYKKIKTIRSFETSGVSDIDKAISLTYTYVYNAGVLSAHTWYTNKLQNELKKKQKLSRGSKKR